MVAIGAGTGVGLERSSTSLLGSRGQIGSATVGRGGDNAFVNAATGNLVITRQDEFLVGLGPDVAISRTYNSQASVGDGDNNDQWRMSPYRQIVGTNGAASITRVDWDGSETVYFQYAANSYATYDGAGAHDWMTWNGSQWTWTDATSRAKDTYDASGKLISAKDADGNTLTYAYNGSLLASITDQNGERTDFVYGGTGGAQLQQITTVAGGSSVRVRYTYDGSNRLSTVIVDLSPADGSIADGKTYVTTYTYDGTSKRVASIAQSDGSLLQIGYASSGADYRVVSLTETVAAGVTRVTGIFYDVPNRVTRITDPAGGVTTMTYDTRGNLTEIVMPVPVPGAAAPTTAFTYSVTGDLLSMTENGRRTDYEYDTSGNLTLSRDSAGNTVVRTYDGRSQVVTSTQYLVPDPDGAGAGAATTPVTTRYVYDAGLESHLRFAISAEGDVIEYQYNAAGQLLSTIAYTVQKYDVSALASNVAPTEATMEAWAAAIADKSTVRRTDTTYDGRGNVWTVTRYSAASTAGAGLLTADYSRDTYVYSASGQLLSRVNNGSSAQEVFVYDGLGRLTSTTNMANATTSFLFTDSASTTTATLASGLTRVAAYNKAGELISVTESGANVTTGVTNYYYDGLGRLRMETNPNNAATYYVYDNASRKVADITTDGSMTEYAYDVNGRLVKTVGYINKLTAAQIALLDDFTAGGSGGAGAGGVGGGPVGSSLLVNGGFETSGAYSVTGYGRASATLPGWTKISGETYEQVSSGFGGVNASEGAFWLDLDSYVGSTLVAVGSNLLTNGSFDTSGSYGVTGYGRANSTLPGWVKAAGESFEQVNSGFGGVNSTDGAYWLDLDTTPSTTFLPTGANLLTNGGFETSAASYTTLSTGRSNATLPGWTKANAENFEQVSSGQMGVTAAEGSFWLDLDSVAGPLAPSGPNLLVNGSFEQASASPTYQTSDDGYQLVLNTGGSIPGWTTINYPTIEQDPTGVGGVAASDGNYWLDMESNSSAAGFFLEQAITGLALGQVLQLKFDHANRTAAANETFQVYWNNTLIATVGATGTTMVTETLQVTAKSGTNRLMFGGVGTANGKGPSLDNVRLYNMVPSGGGNMDISQTIGGRTAGEVMQLEFNHANRTTAASGSFEVWWNNTLVATIADTGAAMQAKSYQVVALAGNNTVRFKSLGTVDTNGASIDNVRLFATVPGPAGGNLDISQTISVASAGTMQLQFDHANRTTAGSGSFEVWWNGALVASVNSTGTAMQAKTYQVSAVAGSNTLRFVGTGTADGSGASIDNVRLFAMQVDPNSANMDISQTVTGLAAGQNLLLQFDHANRTTAASGSFEVWWNGALVATVAETGLAMTAKSYSLTAIAGSNTLRFKGTGTGDATGASLDNVRLFATQGTGGSGASLPDRLAGLRPIAHADDRYLWNVYDAASRLIETIDGAGAVTVFAYDGASRLVSTTSLANLLAAATVTAFKTTSPTVMTLPALDAAKDRVARNFFDKDGLLIGELDSEGYFSRTTYDKAGRKIEATAFANPTNAAYRASGTYSQLLGSITPDAANDRVARWVYDGQGLLRYEVDSYNQIVEFIYNPAGQVTTTIRYNGSIAATADYNHENIKALVAASGLSGNAGTRKTWAVYDAAGRPVYAIDAENAVTRFVYDAAGQVIRTVQYAAKRATTSLPLLATMDSWAAGQAADTANRVTRNYYAARTGELKFSVDAEGYVTRFTYDAAGRQTEVRRWDNAISVTDATTIATVDSLATAAGASTATQMDYDSAGRVITRREAAGAAEQAVTQYVYNARGQLVRTTDARNNATHYYYDKAGRQTVVRDSEDYVTETSYSVFGEVASVTRRYNRATNAAAIGTLPTVAAHAKDAVTSFEYDRLGRVVKTADAEGKDETYVLNAFGDRLKVRNRLGSGVLPGAPTFDSYATINTYDRRGLLLTETLPMASVDSNGTTLAATVTNKFEYDAFGNRFRKTEALGLAEQRTTSYVYDRAGRVTEIRGDSVTVLSQANHSSTSSATPIETFSYDSAGRVIEAKDALGARTLFYYDRLGRKTVEIGPLGTYSKSEYDGNGNVRVSRVYATTVTLPVTAGGTPPAPPAGTPRETTYNYDRLGRLKTSVVTGLRTGAWNGSAYATASGVAVTTTLDYDANGNVIKATDGNNNVTWTWYDKANRRTAQLDQEKYLTTWTLDSEGNATSERRYATQFTGTPSTAAAPSVATGAGDRVTDFTYDRNGRRQTETRSGVTAWTVSSSGVLSAASTSSTIVYDYNGLGQVTRRTEATGEFTDYAYDNSGRLTKETRAGYTDSSGAPVRPTLRYSYDGLNNLTLTRQGGETTAAGDRLTRYTYGAGGRMATMTDANGAVYTYFYDLGGNQLRESYGRIKADGTTSADSLLYTRDLLGRVTAQRLATWNGSAWVNGDSQNSEYNAFGEVSRRGVNGLWQEQFDYDSAGRLWRSNSGDGVWRYFVSDAAGQQTLTIESEGTDLANKTIDEVLAIATVNGAYAVGGAEVDGINATISVFDKRGQATQTRLTKRQLSTSSTADLITSRAYNGFGEVASEVEARGNLPGAVAADYTTTYTYNTMGRVILKESPSVSWTSEGGAVASGRPTETYYYDLGGRLVATRDANQTAAAAGNPTGGMINRRTLLAGTGYGGGEALVLKDFHADAGIVETKYDVFGDARTLINEINQTETRSYDAMGRLTAQTHRGGLLTDTYAYDLLGQRISHSNNINQSPIYGPPEEVWVEDPPYWDNYYGWVYPGTGHYETQTPIIGYEAEKEVTDYDMQGRVTRTVAFGGDTTTTTYVWSSTLATGDMGTFGGWTETTTYANNRTSIDSSDIFGRQLSHTDMGGHVFTVGYDRAGRMTSRSGGEALVYSWLNTGMLASLSSSTGTVASGNWSSRTTTYGYDAAGHVTSEQTVDAGEESYQFYWNPYEPDWYYNSWSNVTQSATAQYDALGRMTSWTEAGSTISPAASNTWQYDLNGNIRRSYASYRTLDAQGTASAGATAVDQWYRYDAMNRVVTERGILSGGTIIRGASGVDYSYNAAGERMSATRTSVETYTYNTDGTLSQVWIAGSLRSTQVHDALGRLTRQTDWIGSGTNAAYDRQVYYNAKGQIGSETVATKQSNGSGGWDTYTSYITNTFGTGTSYTLGAVATITSSNWKNGYDYGSNGAKDTFTSNSYLWFDGAVTSQISFDSESGSSTNPLWTTTYAYNGSGALTSAQINDGRARTVTYTNDLTGQALRRDERDNNYSNGDPHEVWYRFAGKQMGYVGNNGTLDTDYQTSITNRQKVQGTGAFRFGSATASNHADFDLGVENLTSYSQGGGGGSYTVNAGDNLATIAARLWGDAGLWYKLAEANGLSAGVTLIEGQSLIVPAGVMRSTHNASTFRPYDPAETLGDTNPTTPKPNKRSNKCGVFGQILLVAIAVAVTALTYGALGGAALTGVSAVLAGAAASAAGSIASQVVGVATGIQDKFSFKAVAMAAIAGGVGAGVGQVLGKAGMLGSQFLGDAVRGAVGSAVTQGIGVVTGLQKKFDFAAVAAAGIGAGVFGAVSRHLAGKGLGVAPQDIRPDTVRNAAFYANQALSGAAAAIAGAATRSLANGSDFGDNVLAALPDVIGTTIGNMIADPIVAKMEQRRQREAEAQARAHEALLRKLAAIADSWKAPESRFGGARLLLASGQEGFGEPDPFQSIKDRYSLEGVVTGLGEGLRERGQDAFTSAFEVGLRAQLEVIKRWPGTTDLAARIIDRFVSDSPDRVFVFDSRTPEGYAAWQELLTTGPSDYFQSYLDNAVRALVHKYGDETIGGRFVLREGQNITAVRATNLLTPINQALNTNIWRGDMLDWGDLSNGAQLGDLVGTLSSHMNARVENGMVIFEAENRTTLTSAAYGNLSGGAFNRFMNMPTSGPYAPVIQRFRLEVPMSNITNVVYRPAR